MHYFSKEMCFSDLCPSGQVPFLAEENSEPKSCKSNVVFFTFSLKYNNIQKVRFLYFVGM
uniref:Ovule protein n=1 Tax=Heterorhabditis bacteriophora TaxID=37862 RepID=A0A1I7XEH0_HETBA